MKQTLQLITIILFVAFAQLIYAQCDGRYTSEIFTDVTVSTVAYSPVTGFLMDIYQPVGDTYDERAVLIFAHGGSFSAGTKTNPTMVSMCETFAKKGYVTASIQYTLTDAENLLDSLFMIDVVMQAVADSKAAIRFFRQDDANNNTYGIDPDQIWVGGNSAGGILMTHTAYLNADDDVPQYLTDIIVSHGGFDGDRGNSGFSSHVSGVINLAGGINKTPWLSAGDVPIVSAHGDADGTVPYNCNDVFWGSPIFGLIDLINICGSSIMHAQADAVGVENALLTFPGDDHVPWEANNAKSESMKQHVTDFLAARVTCNELSSVSSLDKAFINIYPNPAKEIFTIDLDDNFENFDIYLTDISGKILRTYENVNQSLVVDRGDLTSGLYIIKIQNDSESMNKSIILH